ncbi:MAG TPA: 2Fe-2S iron-sulfur cluster-binding protein [Thermomicrobiales bacterium]|nr:2Fe-2S iron-sulfur cluster-binding protein [Thermomicrobiales bacterium]
MPEAKMWTVDVDGIGSVEVAEGRRLVLGLEDGGIDILHRCGGNARCATCRVEVLEGQPTDITDAEEGRLDRLTNRQDTTRLSCQIRVTDNLSVQVCNRLSEQPQLGDAGPRPIEWPADSALPPEE